MCKEGEEKGSSPLPLTGHIFSPNLSKVNSLAMNVSVSEAGALLSQAIRQISAICAAYPSAAHDMPLFSVKYKEAQRLLFATLSTLQSSVCVTTTATTTTTTTTPPSPSTVSILTTEILPLLSLLLSLSNYFSPPSQPPFLSSPPFRTTLISLFTTIYEACPSADVYSQIKSSMCTIETPNKTLSSQISSAIISHGGENKKKEGKTPANGISLTSTLSSLSLKLFHSLLLSSLLSCPPISKRVGGLAEDVIVASAKLLRSGSEAKSIGTVVTGSIVASATTPSSQLELDLRVAAGATIQACLSGIIITTASSTSPSKFIAEVDAISTSTSLVILKTVKKCSGDVSAGVRRAGANVATQFAPFAAVGKANKVNSQGKVLAPNNDDPFSHLDELLSVCVDMVDDVGSR